MTDSSETTVPQDPIPARHEFRLVLDGIPLDGEQVTRINSAIQKAMLESLTREQVSLDRTLTISHNNVLVPHDWLGIWLGHGDVAIELAKRMREIGVFGRNP